MNSAMVPYKELEAMAADVVRGGLFPGIKTVPQALTLFLVAQAEGLHPMTAAMRYNVIQNRPALKADAMLASFMERGGTVKWVKWTDDECEAVFTSAGVPEGVSVRWTMADAMKAGVTSNPTWKKYPRQMLKARVASDGVRMADPSVNYGRYTPEEVGDFDEPRKQIDTELVEGEPANAVCVRGGLDPEPVAPTIESAEGLTTSEYLAQAKKVREAADGDYCPDCFIQTDRLKRGHQRCLECEARKVVAESNEGSLPARVSPIDKSAAPFDPEKVRAEVSASLGRPKSVPEFCECGAGIQKHEKREAGKEIEYWECAWRNEARHKMKELGKSKKEITEAIGDSHFFKWAGNSTKEA